MRTTDPAGPSSSPPPASPPRDGFSVAGLVAFMARALEDMDPALLPEGFSVAGLRDTRASIGREKRRLADHALAVGGAAPLLEVGRRLRGVALHPGIAVLLDPPAPAVLRERWTRRERYHRSPHRVEIAVEGDRAWRCTHASRAAAPSPAESLLVAGTLAGLLELVGAEGVDLRFGDGLVDRAALAAGASIDAVDAHRFSLRWTGADAANAIDLSAVPGRAPRAPETAAIGAAVPDDGATAARVLALIGGDVARRWTLAEVSRALSTSPRSLQRALGADGLAFSTMLREARVAEAARLLRDTDRSLGLVGFVAGFADQPHFQREFVRTLDVTPAQYRTVARLGAG